MKLKSILFLLLSSIHAAGYLRAQDVSLRAVRVEKSPVLDGSLDEDVWSQATPFTGFKQVFPIPGNEPSERTELRIIYDSSNLYIGIICFDREPTRISANSMAHDSTEEQKKSDDVIQILLDPFQNRRTGYLFIINPLGARTEGLGFGEHCSLNWDGIWYARSRIGEEGWSTEIEIPFKTISFKPGLEAWGINIERYIARKQESIRLSGIRLEAFFYNAAETAPLQGVGGVKQGLGITFRPYGTTSAAKDHASAADADWGIDGGFDLYKNFTSNFVGAVSYNTDFAETEVDDRRVNLTRFALYFPEKRTFFLEGSEIYNFGTSGGGGGYVPGREPGFVPFFSRRIGLYEGHPVPIVFGTKVFGRLGETNISLLDVGTKEYNDLPRQNYVAGRVYQNILEESKVGFIFTSGSPEGGRNTLAGVDLIFQTSRFRGNQNLAVGGWYAYNWNTIKTGRHRGFGFKIDYPNDLWDCAMLYSNYGDALNPGLGFLPRNNVQTLTAAVNFRPRPEKGLVGAFVRQFFFELRTSFYWDLEGRLETRRIFTAPFKIRTESGEQIEFNIVPSRDVLPYDFEVSKGIFIPRGSYNFTNCAVVFNSADHRPWGFSLNWKFGQFYSGQYKDAQIGFALKLRGNLSLDFKTNIVRGHLPQGKFKENVFQLKADFYLSPDLGLLNYIQYDDISKQLGINIRVRWQITPGNEIHFVYTKNWERRWDPVSRFVPLEERGVFKIQFSIRP